MELGRIGIFLPTPMFLYIIRNYNCLYILENFAILKDNGGDRTERSQLFFVKQFSYTAVAVVTDRIAKNPAGLEYLPCLF